MRKVFISHSSTDLAWAQEICRLLEENNAQCFLSERDLDRSDPSWPLQLMNALIASDLVVLLLTRDSNTSNEVLNEIANASGSGMNVIPVLQKIIPVRKELMYFIRKYEWICLEDFSVENGRQILLTRVLGARPEGAQDAPVAVVKNELTQYEDPCFEGIDTGGYGAGQDKCLIQRGAAGWDPHDVILEAVIDEDFTFASIGRPELDEAYAEYCRSSKARIMEARGNNRTRWMVAGLYQNDRIFLTLQKTCFGMTSFWWDQVRDNPQMQKKMADHAFGQEDAFYPNSFCLHLILETQDGKVVCTKTSNNKKNDYPKSLAITIGEQISEIDFGGNLFYNSDFVTEWIKRSIIEEFHLGPGDYDKYVDESSARVLALSYEGDIYNYALPVYVRLKMDFQGFLNYLNSKNFNSDEFVGVFSLSPAEALEITRSWADPAVRDRYHPSSFLRALLYATYKGADRAL